MNSINKFTGRVEFDHTPHFFSFPTKLLTQVKQLEKAILEKLPKFTFSINQWTWDSHLSFIYDSFQVQSISIFDTTSSHQLNLKSHANSYICSYSPFLLLEVTVSIARGGIWDSVLPKKKHTFLASYSPLLGEFEYFLHHKHFNDKQGSAKTKRIDRYRSNLERFEDPSIMLISEAEKLEIESSEETLLVEKNISKFTLAFGDITAKFPNTSALISKNFHILSIASSHSVCSTPLPLNTPQSVCNTKPLTAFHYNKICKSSPSLLPDFFKLDMVRRQVSVDRIRYCLLFNPEVLMGFNDNITPIEIPQSALSFFANDDSRGFCGHHAYGFAPACMVNTFYHEIIITIAKYHASIIKADLGLDDNAMKFVDFCLIQIYEVILLRNFNLNINQSAVMYLVFSDFIALGRGFDLRNTSPIAAKGILGYPDINLAVDMKTFQENRYINHYSNEISWIQYNDLFVVIQRILQTHLEHNHECGTRIHTRLPKVESIFKAVLFEVEQHLP